MTPERWRQITEVFQAALARDTVSRDAFLDERCRDDAGLREEVATLLAAHLDASALDRPIAGIPAAVGTRIGPYRLEELIGEGGMGQVFRARDAALGRDVAIKLLPAHLMADPQRRERFAREARLLAALNHPHIAHVYGVEERDGVRALVMELVDGQTLGDVLASARLPVPKALALARQIAQALDAAHDKGIVHRDLKPANIKITSNDDVKVLDFGLAKALEPEGADRDVASSPTMTAQATEIGMILGTAAYMAPEQASGRPVDKRADVWAFGVVLFEMLTGRRLFEGETVNETLAAVLRQEIDLSPLPADTPPAVRRLLRRCLERDVKQRWGHMGDARLVIEEALANEPESAAATPRAAISRRQVILYGAGSLALAATGLGAGAWLEQRLRPPVVPAFRRLTFRRGVIRSARFAPDGETILYGALWDDDRCRVHTVRVDGPESRALDLPDANILAVSRSGELALSLGGHVDGIITYGTLARVPMAGGAPREILEDVRFADWSPDGTDLAIVRRVDGRDRLEFPIGQVLVAPTAGQGDGLGFARVSPDGRHVAFVQYRSPSVLTGRVMMVDRSGTVTALSPEYQNIHGLTWRGGDLVYSAAAEPLYRSVHVVTPGRDPRTITRTPGNITVWDAAGPDGRLVTAQTDDRTVMAVHLRGEDADRDLSWLDGSYPMDLSADGKQVLFAEFGQGSGPEGAGYLRGTDGSAAVRLGAGTALALSPDMRWAIFLAGPLASHYLELVPTGAGQVRRLADHGLFYAGARWLPDGKRIVVWAAEPDRPLRLFMYGLDPGAGRPVPFTPEGITDWVLSPDGSMAAARGPSAAIRLYPIDGSAPRDIPGLNGPDVPVGWITTGLLVARPDDPASALGSIYRVDTATGRQSLWKSVLPRERAGLMKFTSFRVTPDGLSYAHSWHRALSSLYLADGLA
jgi:hypothetical protein